jgi:hypothetical protein
MHSPTTPRASSWPGAWPPTDDPFPKLTEWSGTQCRLTATLDPGCLTGSAPSCAVRPIGTNFAPNGESRVSIPRPIDPYPTIRTTIRTSTRTTASATSSLGAAGFLILVVRDDRSGSTAALESSSLLSAGRRKMKCFFLPRENCSNRPFSGGNVVHPPASHNVSSEWEDPEQRIHSRPRGLNHPNAPQTLPLTPHDSGRQRRNPELDFVLFFGIFGNPYEPHFAAPSLE